MYIKFTLILGSFHGCVTGIVIGPPLLTPRWRQGTEVYEVLGKQVWSYTLCLFPFIRPCPHRMCMHRRKLETIVCRAAG